MKKKLLFLPIALIAFFNLDLVAQNWILGGNNLPAGGGELGSNNNQHVFFETNGARRGVLSRNGRWGFGITGANALNARVHIRSTTSLNPFQVDIGNNAIFFISNTQRVGINSIAPAARLHINSASGEDALRVQVNGATKLWVNNNGGVSVGNAFVPPSNGLFVQGNAGIGTSSPAVKLHIIGGSDASPAGGGYIVTGSTTGANVVIDENEIMARNNGAASDLFLNHNGGNLLINGTNSDAGGGNVGIRTTAPAVEFHMFHGVGSGATNGLRIRNEGANANDWTLYVQNSSGNLELYKNGSFRGSFDDASGAYTASSDRRVKKDIEEASDVLSKVMQLNIKKYHFLANAPGEKKYYGLIAQDVEKIFPEIVFHHNADDGTEYYTMDYTAYGVLSIKAIQEMQQKITTLEDRIAKLERMINSVSSSDARGKEITGASLQQNQPNPFRQNTIIRYTLPAGMNAQIMIYDASGRLVKTLQATGSGQSQINGGELKAGTYRYTMVANGNVIASKTMVLLK